MLDEEDLTGELRQICVNAVEMPMNTQVHNGMICIYG